MDLAWVNVLAMVVLPGRREVSGASGGLCNFLLASLVLLVGNVDV